MAAVATLILGTSDLNARTELLKANLGHYNEEDAKVIMKQLLSSCTAEGQCGLLSTKEICEARQDALVLLSHMEKDETLSQRYQQQVRLPYPGVTRERRINRACRLLQNVEMWIRRT